MNDNKLIKFLIPLVAAVVVFESIVLVNNLEKSGKNTQEVKTEEKTQQVVEKVVENPIIDFGLKVNSTNSAQMKVGKTYKVELSLSSKELKAVDGIETYIKYDPEIFKITNLTADSKLVKPEISKIDNENGLLSNIILIEDKNGMVLNVDKGVVLFTFSVTPLEEGNYTLGLSHESIDKKFDTLVVETGTAKSLGWTGGKLDVQVTK